MTPESGRALAAAACLVTLFITLAFPPLRPIGVIAPTGIFWLWVVLVGSGVAWLAKGHVNVVRQPRSATLLAAVVLVTFTGFCAVFYSWSSALVVGNSTGDDAIIVPFQAWLTGDGLYSGRLFDGVPISPGQMWIIANGWLSWLHVHFLLTPLHLGLCLALLTRELSLPFLLILLASPLAWTTAGTGHDHLAIGLCLLALYLITPRLARSPVGFMLLILACATLATARIIYLPFPLLLALSADGLSPRQRRWLASTASIVAMAAVAASWSPEYGYPPLHLLQRGINAFGPTLLITALVAGSLMAGWLWSRLDPRHRGPVFYTLGLVTPHLAIAGMELVAVGGDISRWEGANYVLPAMPILIYATLRLVLGNEARQPAN